MSKTKVTGYWATYCTVKMDIDEKDMIMEFRRKRLVRRLVKISANEIARTIPILICASCKGCASCYLSQMHHTCLAPMGKFAKLNYFDIALDRTSEDEVMKEFMENLKTIDLYVLEQNPIHSGQSPQTKYNKQLTFI